MSSSPRLFLYVAPELLLFLVVSVAFRPVCQLTHHIARNANAPYYALAERSRFVVLYVAL